jgi:RimJ/RimL family protein N-acetyltransferase
LAGRGVSGQDGRVSTARIRRRRRGPDRIEGRAEVGDDASRGVAEQAGFTGEGLLRQARRTGGERRDCRAGSLVKGDSA